jgi:hemolysin activation/secretion protein/AraC-like DNA-binding protein
MTVERHLILQEMSLRPSGEWSPGGGWTVVRVAEGMGYCLQAGTAQELNVGDMVIAGPNAAVTFRASQLGVIKLDFFLILPQYLNGLLTVTEWRQLEDASSQIATRTLHFAAGEPPAQKFTRLAAQSQRDSLAARAALLQLWAASITSLLPACGSNPMVHNLRERFRQFVGRMPEAELALRPLTQLAGEMHCSERHFSRLFREEFHISLRARQTELRLQRARQLLAESDAKVINVALESGYRHLGLFNAMFKRRFGVTPSQWRQQNFSAPPQNFVKRAAPVLVLLLLLANIFFASAVGAQSTNFPAPKPAAATNAGPHFKVEKYLVSGNTVLAPGQLGQILTNLPAAFGTNVSLADIRAELADLQMAYRERGFVTVSVGLPQQKLTNATVKIKVTEGRLSDIKVQGNNYYSTENVLRSLPSLHTNMLLNSRVFQRELDQANANRDRQIYPVIGPGLEPGTSELTLKVKDRLPLHARVEVNNDTTPGTPDSRIAFNAQYDNLWQLEHQIGISYSFSPINYGTANTYYFSPLDLPQIANESVYYRLPLGRTVSVQQQIDQSGGQFGYNEVTHQFQMPPPSGRPELTIYGSRATTDSGISLDAPQFINLTPLQQEGLQTASETVTLNQGLGFKFSLPLPELKRISSTLALGMDYKHYQSASISADTFYHLVDTTNAAGVQEEFGGVDYSQQQAQNAQVDYFPVNLGISGSAPDSYGITFFNAQANFNIATVGHIGSVTHHAGTNSVVVPGVAYAPNAADNYFTLQMGASREQRIYKDWTVLLHADGQWASTPLFSNEQYGMGGLAGVRGYMNGNAYGDTGWRVMLEPRTPQVNIGMADGTAPFWMRASVFMDYGQVSVLNGYFARKTSMEGPVIGTIPGNPSTLDFWGTGWSLIGNIGNHLDARFTMSFPLINTGGKSGWSPLRDMQIYFAVGAQF